MAPKTTYAEIAAGRSSDEVEEEESWGAADSLRRIRRTVPPSEQTPLLVNVDGAEERRSSTWEGQADLEGLKWWRRPSVAWLLPPFFLFALAIGGIIVPKLNLILSLVCRDYLIEKSTTDPSFIFAPVLLGGNNPQCRIPEVQALVSEFTLVLTVLAGLMSAVVAPKLGALSDRYGRLKILVVSSLGAFSAELITIAVANYPDVINYRWILLGAFFDGASGSFTSAMAICYAYAADCTAPPKRAIAFGRFHACLFSGIALGPLLAAFLYKKTHDLLTIFYFAVGVHAVLLTFMIIVIPESLSKKRQLLAREKHAAHRDALTRRDPSWLNTIRRANILEPLKILWPTGPGTSSSLRLNLSLLASVDTIMFGVAMGAMTVVLLYTGFQFGWETDDTSIFISVVNVVRVSGLILLLPLLNYLFRTRRSNRQRRESGFALPEPNSGSDSLDLWTIRFAIIMEAIGYLGYTLSRTGSQFVASGILAAFGGVGSPTLQSSLTKHVPHDRVGSLLGATGLLHALARVVAPLIFNLIYAKTVARWRQAVFAVLCACFGVAFLGSWGIRTKVYLEELTTSPSTTLASSTTDSTKVGSAPDEESPQPNRNRDVQLDEEISGI